MILITGSAGFIGFHLAKKILEKDETVIGIDNLNDYYNVKLKQSRLNELLKFKKYQHYKIDLENMSDLSDIFKKYKPDKVVNLAAQAGVRHSIQEPKKFIDSNILGFSNLLELCKDKDINHLVYASSSSVYGSNKKIPFSVNDSVDHPVSTYAMTKKTNELMAHVYSHLYKIPTTGLRYFTVYGPYGRPDMAMYKFTESIINKKEIDVYNFGKHRRDFTYISDIVEATIKILDHPPKKNSDVPWKIYNIGNNKTIDLNYFISLIENELGTKAIKNFLPLQKGDTYETFANIDELISDFNYRPKISIEMGVKKFIDWYKEFHKL
jgi:UDP-glucuronate 4-epimerase